MTAKYIVWGVLLLLMAGSCSGCGNGNEAAENGETTEIFGTYSISPAGVLRVDDHGYLQFYSREADDTVYLCNQAGCAHQNKNCSAYVENLQTAFYNNGDLYFIQYYGPDRTQVIKANRYGENRQILGEADVLLLPHTMHIDEDILYFIGDKWVYKGNESTNTQELYAFHLQAGTLEAFPNVDTGYSISNVSDFLVTDRYIYTQYTACNTDINDYFDFSTGELREIEWDSIEYAYLLYRMDRRTGETELLIREEGAEQVGLTLLEAEEESFIIRLYDDILQYEGTELVETLYTYSGDEEYWLAEPIGEGYLLCDRRAPYRFRILEEFTETGSFIDPEGNVNCYHGMVGNTLYFGGDYTLYYMEMEDFKAGNYEFHLIDID